MAAEFQTLNMKTSPSFHTPGGGWGFLQSCFDTWLLSERGPHIGGISLSPSEGRAWMM